MQRIRLQKRAFHLFILAALLGCTAKAQEAGLSQAGDLVGPVKTVRVDRAAVIKKSDKFEEGPRTQMAFSTYDQAGRLFQSLIGLRGGSTFKTYKAQYADDQNRVEEVYGGVAAPDVKFVTLYDPANRKAEATEFDAKGKPAGRTAYAFDDSLRVIDEIRYDRKGQLLERTQFTYGAGTVEQSHSQGQAAYRTVITLNAQGRPVDEKYYRPDGSLIVRTHRAYDERGNCIDELIDTGAGGLHWRYGYEYDARGNWTVRKTTRQTLNDGLPEYEPVEVVYRGISYYESDQRPPSSTDASEVERMRLRTTGSLLLGEAVAQTPLYNPGRTVGTGVAGQITMFVMTDDDGEVLQALPLSGFDQRLNDLAETATRRWRFRPTLMAGRVAPSVRLLRFEYKPDFR